MRCFSCLCLFLLLFPLSPYRSFFSGVPDWDLVSCLWFEDTTGLPGVLLDEYWSFFFLLLFFPVCFLCVFDRYLDRWCQRLTVTCVSCVLCVIGVFLFFIFIPVGKGRSQDRKTREAKNEEYKSIYRYILYQTRLPMDQDTHRNMSRGNEKMVYTKSIMRIIN